MFCLHADSFLFICREASRNQRYHNPSVVAVTKRNTKDLNWNIVITTGTSKVAKKVKSISCFLESLEFGKEVRSPMSTMNDTKIQEIQGSKSFICHCWNAFLMPILSLDHFIAVPTASGNKPRHQKYNRESLAMTTHATTLRLIRFIFAFSAQSWRLHTSECNVQFRELQDIMKPWI